MQILVPKTVKWQTVTILQIQNGGRPRYWKQFSGYISTTNCPLNTKFGIKKHNHVRIQVTWPKYQISKIQHGGRPPFWKWFYRNIADVKHPISMKFGVRTQCWFEERSRDKVSKFANSKWLTAAILKIVISYISMIYCPINAQFGMKKQNHTQIQVTLPKYQTAFLFVGDYISAYRSGGRSELIGDVFLCWLFYKDKSAICTQSKFLT